MIVESALVVGAYLLGSLPTAFFVVRQITGQDVRSEGSHNVGATNAARLAGWRAGVAVTVVDIGKGALPMLVMREFNPSGKWLAAVLLAAVIGHCFPVWLRFRGGKGVATGFGGFLVLAPAASAAALVIWVLVLLVSRYVALASLVSAAAFPILMSLINRPYWPLLAAASGVAALIILRHAVNIRNILAGEEPRIGPNGPGDGGEL